VFKKLLLSAADVVEGVGIKGMAGFPALHNQRAGEIFAFHQYFI
jgi:hypothetical protein